MAHLVVRTDGRSIEVEDLDSRRELLTDLPFSVALLGSLLERVRRLNEDPFVATAEDALLALRARGPAAAPRPVRRGIIALMPLRPRGERRA